MAEDLSKWYRIKFDKDKIYRETSPKEHEGWSDSIEWKRIIRIGYRTAVEFTENDEFFIFTDERDESYVIPSGAAGATELWAEIMQRGLFPPELSIKCSLNSGSMECWPPEENGGKQETEEKGIQEKKES